MVTVTLVVPQILLQIFSVFFWSGHSHLWCCFVLASSHISGSQNFITNIFQIFLVRPFSSMVLFCSSEQRHISGSQNLITNILWIVLVQAILIYGGVLFCSSEQPCSSVVRAFAHGAMGRRIDPSWWTH